MSRRYLNVVVQDLRSYLYSLRRIDLKKDLFYRDSEVAQQAAQDVSGKNKNKRGGVVGGWKNLPPPSINFQPAPSSMGAPVSHSITLLGGENNILYTDPRSRSVLYNIHSKFVESIPSPSQCKTPYAICLPITQADPVYPIKFESQYILDLTPNTNITSCFEVLSYRKEEWCWDVLPPPPFFSDPETAPDAYSCAVVNGSTICISPSPSVEQEGIGTYTFDTVSSNWRRAADWVLPFFGNAAYVPELNLWFGLSGSNPFCSLCAFDLSAMDSVHPPIPLHTWDYLDIPEDETWLPTQLCLLNLGLGKFCVSTLFGTILSNCSYSYSDEEDMDSEEYAIFTGLEVKRSNNGDGPPQLIKHKSKRYDSGSCYIQGVL